MATITEAEFVSALAEAEKQYGRQLKQGEIQRLGRRLGLELNTALPIAQQAGFAYVPGKLDESGQLFYNPRAENIAPASGLLSANVALAAREWDPLAQAEYDRLLDISRNYGFGGNRNAGSDPTTNWRDTLALMRQGLTNEQINNQQLAWRYKTNPENVAKIRASGGGEFDLWKAVTNEMIGGGNTLENILYFGDPQGLLQTPGLPGISPVTQGWTAASAQPRGLDIGYGMAPFRRDPYEGLFRSQLARAGVPADVRNSLSGSALQRAVRQIQQGGALPTSGTTPNPFGVPGMLSGGTSQNPWIF